MIIFNFLLAFVALIAYAGLVLGAVAVTLFVVFKTATKKHTRFRRRYARRGLAVPASYEGRAA